MQPFYFGPPERRLFGVFHSARVRSDKAIVLCNPFGQEAIRVHRFFRVLAERLARMGIAVLRFDFFGTGDSAGDDAEGEFSGWSRDLLVADMELRRRSEATAVSWLGVRLGATIAVKATGDATHRPDHLVLWEPIVDGAAYLRTLAKATVDSIQDSLCIADPRWSQMLKSGSLELNREGVGFELGERLRIQFGELLSDGIAVPRAGRTSLIHSGRQRDLDALIRRWRRDGGSVTEDRYLHDFDWLAEEAQDASLVPPAMVEMLVATAVTRR